MEEFDLLIKQSSHDLRLMTYQMNLINLQATKSRLECIYLQDRLNRLSKMMKSRNVGFLVDVYLHL